VIAYWMLYCLAVGALVTLGALALERAMRAFRLPQRWVWAAAMVLTLAVPAAVRWLPRATEPAAAGAVLGGPADVRIGAAAAAEAGAGFDLSALDGPLLLGWMGSGLVVLAALGAASLLLARRRRGWRAAVVDGVPVLLSPDTGPAVVGLVRSRIVLPAWVMDADPAARTLLLEHEREHLRARDPRLLALGLAAVALAPWNAAAWYQLRRLRLAIEIDCDARVLARRGDVRAYGTLLLEAGRRASSAGWTAAAAFSEPASFLERRIRIMSSRMQRPRARVVLPALALCAAALAGMRALPAPAVPAPRPAESSALQPERPGSAAAGDTTRPVLANAQEVVRALDQQYPPQLRAAGITGSASLRILVSAEGVPTDVQAVEATNPEFGAAAVRAMQAARFRPARHEGTAVAFSLIIPVLFQLDEDDPDDAPPLTTAPPETAAPRWDEAPIVANVEEVTRALRTEYPPLLRAAGIEAQAQVRLRISATGEVLEAAAESASHPEAGPAAERALRRARFQPARRDGRAVEVELVLPVRFQLDRGETP
jgi:TonB family protein